MSSFYQFNRQLLHNQFLAGLVIFLISLIIFSYLQFYNGIVDPDAFYHVKLTQLMSQQGLVTDFPWMQFSTWKEGFVDHHFLYHLLMIPFVSFLPPLIGGKVFQIILCSLAVLAFYYLLDKLRIKYSFYFTLLLFLCPPLLFRVSLVKAQPLSLIILFIGLSFIFQKKYFYLFVASLVYVLSYGGWILLPLLAVIMAGVSALNDAWFLDRPEPDKKTARLKRFIADFIRLLFRKDNLLLIFTSALGALAGLIVNPFFPQNIHFYWVHIFQIGLVNYQNKIGVGAEWYPYDFWELMKNALLPITLIVFSFTFLLKYFKQAGRESKFFALIAILFLLLTLKSRRNIEYFIPLAIAASACCFNLLHSSGEPESDRAKIKSLAKKLFPPPGWPQRLFIASGTLIIIIAFVASLISTKQVLVSYRYSYTLLEGASNYLKSHSRPGEIVFNGNWASFPMLFYNNDSNYYIIGLDPTFMYLYDKTLQLKMIDLTLGKRYEEAYDIIKNGLHARFVQVEEKNKALQSLLDNNFKFKKVYEDGEGAVYEVL